MSIKRTLADCNDDQQPNEDSDLFQQQGKAKRAKLDPLCDTTLQDLPIELIECILIKAVVMEVKGMKLVKSVWKEKADLVITRLEAVCSHWSSILTTNFFRKEVHKLLDGTAQETIRLEILHRSPIQVEICTMKIKVEIFTTMKDEMFIVCKPQDQDYAINIHDRNNVTEVKDVIPLPGILPVDIAACTLSNCVYVLNEESNCRHSVLRITKDEEHKFNISPWISDLRLSSRSITPNISVSASGSLMILLKYDPTVVSIYNASGSLQHEIMLSPSIYGFRMVYSVILKSNGNLVMASTEDYDLRIDLQEIDTRWRIVRKYISSLRGCSGIGIADMYDRILVACGSRFEFLDSELNLMDFTDPYLHDSGVDTSVKYHYSSERNEIARMSRFGNHKPRVLTIFRFVEG